MGASVGFHRREWLRSMSELKRQTPELRQYSCGSFSDLTRTTAWYPIGGITVCHVILFKNLSKSQWLVGRNVATDRRYEQSLNWNFCPWHAIYKGTNKLLVNSGFHTVLCTLRLPSRLYRPTLGLITLTGSCQPRHQKRTQSLDKVFIHQMLKKSIPFKIQFCLVLRWPQLDSTLFHHRCILHSPPNLYLVARPLCCQVVILALIKSECLWYPNSPESTGILP